MTATIEQAEKSVAKVQERIVLTAVHRCDAGKCGAQARSHVIFSDGGDLMFCRHHTEAFREGIVEAGGTIDTQYEGLNVKVESSAP